MSDHMKEVERLLDEFYLHVSATVASALADEWAEVEAAQKRSVQARSALLAHIQRGAVPDGWQVVPKEPTPEMISHTKSVEHCGSREPHTSNIYRAMLAAAPAPDHFRDAAKMAPVHCTPTEHDGRIVYEHTSEPIPNADGFVLYAAPAPDRFRAAAKMMAVQPACMTCSGHGMVGGLLPNGGGYEADPCPDCAAPVTAGVPMPKPVAYGFGNTAITGHTNRLMMVRIDIPGGDQYAGAFWLPLVLADEAHTYGVACRAAGEAAGYARGLRDAVRDADIEALRLYVRALCKAVDAATDFAGTVAGGASWWDDVWADHAAALDRARERISQAALRGEVK